MKKIINALIIALALSFVFPVVVRAEETENIKCECGNKNCTHRLPTRTFDTFEEWEEYYFAHREVGIYWDSYLYKSGAYRYDKDGNRIWKPSLTYPFNDMDTWLYWFDTCHEKSVCGEYKYEYAYLAKDPMRKKVR